MVQIAPMASESDRCRRETHLRFQICLDNFDDTRTYMEMVFRRFYPPALERFSLADKPRPQSELNLAKELFAGM